MSSASPQYKATFISIALNLKSCKIFLLFTQVTLQLSSISWVTFDPLKSKQEFVCRSLIQDVFSRQKLGCGSQCWSCGGLEGPGSVQVE